MLTRRVPRGFELLLLAGLILMSLAITHQDPALARVPPPEAGGDPITGEGTPYEEPELDPPTDPGTENPTQPNEDGSLSGNGARAGDRGRNADRIERLVMSPKWIWILNYLSRLR